MLTHTPIHTNIHSKYTHTHTNTHTHNSPTSLMSLPPLAPQLLNSLTPEENTRCRHGLYFQDGQRRVDYILTYHIKKPSSSRSRRTSRLTDNAFTRSLRRGRAQPPPPPPPPPPSPPAKGDPEAGGTTNHSLDYHEDDKRLRREEFEGNLREMGLELEKDENVSSASVPLSLSRSFSLSLSLCLSLSLLRESLSVFVLV